LGRGGTAGDGGRLRGEAARILGGRGSIILNIFESGGLASLHAPTHAVRVRPRQETKVFCFFFSKKKCFLPSFLKAAESAIG
jgi:hypothetical protein